MKQYYTKLLLVFPFIEGAALLWAVKRRWTFRTSWQYEKTWTAKHFQKFSLFLSFSSACHIMDWKLAQTTKPKNVFPNFVIFSSLLLYLFSATNKTIVDLLSRLLRNDGWQMTIFDIWYFWVDWWKWWKAMWLTRQGVGVREGWNLQYLLVISEFFIQIFVTLSELDERPNFGIFTKKELAFSERESSLPCFVSFPNCCIRLYGQTGFSTTQCTHNVEILL